MENGLDPVLAEDALEPVLVREAADDEPRSADHRVAVPGLQVVVDRDVMAGVDERLHARRAHVAGTADDENAHALNPAASGHEPM
jgi:hypothetical protein